MKRHKCGGENQQSLASLWGSAANTPKVSRTDKERITKACVTFCSQDLRPFDIIGGGGFQTFCQDLLRLQHQHKALLKIEDILPHPTTVSRHIRDSADNIRQQISSSLQEAIASTSVSFTSDMWTDSHQKRSFLMITAHWISENFELQNKVIATEEFDAAEKKTGANIRSAVNAIFSAYGITTDQLKKCTFTTDRGSNMIVAFKDEDRLDCVAHILNTVLRHVFDEKKDCPSAVTHLIQSCKSLVVC